MRPGTRESVPSAADTKAHQVTRLELFFDAVVVFAVTPVTAFLAEHADIVGAGRAILVLALMWWCWTAFALVVCSSYIWRSTSVGSARWRVVLQDERRSPAERACISVVS